ncbi:MAG: hypothetical protein SGI77_23920 [Pirellulaceae bacterium]|nr:hypothetical protein [Pirellulaceae bacterium]
MLAEKGRFLEEQFFRERDLELLEYLRSQAVEKEQRTKSDEIQLRNQLAEIAPIHEIEVLDELIRAGITAESFVALTLLPLVRVAWADGSIQDRERVAILKAAAAEGIAVDSANYRLLEGWLDERPEPTLLEAWRDYTVALTRELDAASLAAIRRITMDRARRIADSSGGILGLVSRISKGEELALIDLARAFDKPKELLL